MRQATPNPGVAVAAAGAGADPPVDAPAVLQARDLVRSFGAVHAVAGLSLRVESGQLYGLVGPDGAGKTTTIRLLAGLMDPDAGEALVLGQPSAAGLLATREAIGYMPQQYSLYGDLSVDENLRFFSDLFGLSRDAFSARRARLLSITRLERFGDRRAEALSGGMYKKLALACALLHQPRALILDEPTNGVDPVSRRELWDLLYELVAGGMAVLIATPYMDEAERCHRVGLIHHGALLEEGEPRALTAAFAHGSFILHATDRAELERALDAREDVLSMTPYGAALRVVVHQRAVDDFTAWAAACAAAGALERTRPDFEDVFLARMASESEAPAAGAQDPEGAS